MHLLWEKINAHSYVNIIRENYSQRKPIYYFFAVLVIYSRSRIITRTPGSSWLSVSAMPQACPPPPMIT